MPDIAQQRGKQRDEQRILICAPLGKDAELSAAVLLNAGLDCCVCKDFASLLRELRAGAGAILAVEEVLPAAATTALTDYILSQPAWSDLPIMVLTKTGGNSPWIKGAYQRLGNLTLLERPVRASTLVSAARSTLRARQRQYEIRKADQRKDEFLAMLGHELRNPLAPIGAAAQILELMPADTEKVKRASEIIARQVNHMTSLIDDLLDVARVTRGLIAMDKGPVDIRHILSEAVEQVSPLIRKRRHHLSLHLPPDPAPVHGDRKRLIQVVANILQNAAKYTPEGGNIVVRLEVLAEEVVLQISDNGIGMAPDMVAHVFDLFAQAERTSDRSQGGLGLGLSLVRSLVESHGGTVQVASEGSDRGSIFTVRLPYRNEPPAAAIGQPAPCAVAAPPAPLRVLVVDDNADAADTLRMLLDATGYDVSVEYSATAAVEQVRSKSPQVCLLDIGLPDMDGNELAKRLRAIPETAGSTLIAITGYGQEPDREKARAAGFDYHFVKPVDAHRLLALLAGLS